MDPRTNDRIPVTSSEESLDLSLDGTKTDARKTEGRRVRACPFVALLALFLHMLSSGCGITLSVLIVRYGLEVGPAGILNLVARIMLFAASCIGPFYVFMHLIAAREPYVRSRQSGTPQIFGYVSVAVAVLVMRIELPVWITTVVVSAVLAVQKGFDPALGFNGNLVWVQLIIASVALLSLIILVIVTEITERPFATSIFSRRSFIKGTDKAEDGSDTLELSISQQGDRPGDRRSQIETQTEEVKKMSSDRTTVNSPESPEITGSPDNSYWGASPQQQTQRQSMLRDDERQTRDTLRYDGSRRQETDRMYPPQPRQNNMRYNRPRSQFFPEPLESVYSPDAFSPDVEGSPLQNRSLFSWRPPTRESMHSQPRNSFSRRPDEASTVSTTRISTVEPASQPPSMPLPPMPLRETPEELAMPPSRAFAQERPFTAPESAASPVFPSEVRAEAPPSIAQLLSALSTRAAARRRNSLVVRQAELAPVTESIDMGPADSTLNSNMTSILFPRPEEEEPVEQEIRPPPTRRATTARDLLSENGEPLALRSHPFRPSNATSGAIFMAYQDPYEPEEFKGPKRAAAQRPTTAPRDMKSENDYPPAPSEHSLQRSVLNFSRPRLPGMGSEYDDDAETVNGGARSIVGELRARPTATGLRNRTVRRSRSLPTLVERPWSSPDDDDDDTPQERPWAPRDHTPRRPAPREDGSQFGDSSNLTSGETHTPTTETGVRADVRTTTTIAPSARAPRFSPFPRVPGGPTSTSNADAEQKMRAQVSSSVRRRNERIARWREEVQADDSPTYQA